MPAAAELLRQESKLHADIAAEVRTLRAELPDLPLKRLARLGGTSATVLCEWERGHGSLRSEKRRLIRSIVRAEFAQYAMRIAELSARHGIGPRAPQDGGA
jgi:DNA-binding transcriptional regulator YiaG